MAKPSRKPLQQNPFTTYRDPETGKWIVVMSDIARQRQRHSLVAKRVSPRFEGVTASAVAS